MKPEYEWCIPRYGPGRVGARTAIYNWQTLKLGQSVPDGARVRLKPPPPVLSTDYDPADTLTPEQWASSFASLYDRLKATERQLAGAEEEAETWRKAAYAVGAALRDQKRRARADGEAWQTVNREYANEVHRVRDVLKRFCHLKPGEPSWSEQASKTAQCALDAYEKLEAKLVRAQQARDFWKRRADRLYSPPRRW